MDSEIYHRGDKMVDVLFASNIQAQRAADRVRQDKPIESLLGMMSNDPEMIEINARLSNLSELLPETTDDLGRTSGNGVPGNFYGVRSVPGFPMKDGTFPLTDNTLKRKNAGLSDTWVEPWHRELFKSFCHVFFEDLRAVPMRLRKGSSSVNPIFTKDPTDRRTLAMQALAEAKIAGDLWVKGDFTNAYLSHHFGGCYYVVYRSQNSDKISFDKKTGLWSSKDRTVADLEYAVSGGARGTLFISSKELDDVDFSVPKGFYRTRLRTAMGLSFKTSAAQMPVFQAVRKKIYDLYAFSFHHTTRMQKEEKLRAWGHSIFADVSDHDINWPKKLYIPVVEEVLNELGWSQWGIALLLRSLDLPIYVSAPAVGKGHVLLGNWRRPNVNVGLPSGNPGTDIWGSLGMSFNYCLVQIIHTAPEYADVIKRGRGKEWSRDYLAGRLDIAAMSKSDDAAMLWKGVVRETRALALHKRMRDEKDFLPSPYIAVSYEHGGKFLGDLAIYGASKEAKSIIMAGDIRSDIFNTFVPEYSVDSGQPDRTKVKRSYPGLAWSSRAQVYGSHPSYGVVTEHIERTYRNVTGRSYQAMRTEWEKADQKALSEHLRRQSAKFTLGDFTTQDLEVLANSEKLSHKYEADDINPDVVAISEFRIEVEQIAPYLKAFTNQQSVH